MNTITAIVIAKNEASLIANCLDTLKWCDEIVVIDNASDDTTAALAARSGARVVTLAGSFSELRNEGLRRSKTDWVLYIDADERVTPALAKEIREAVSQASFSAYRIWRANVMYGRHLSYGGWQKDGVVRLFKREALQKWAGLIHEHAEVTGETGDLHQQLIHFTHRSVISGLYKTCEWTPLEAQQLFEADVPPVTASTLVRKGGMELFRRLIKEKGYKDGIVGWIEALVQAMNRVIVYIQVWELQQKPSLPQTYQAHETEVAQLWKNAKVS